MIYVVSGFPRSGTSAMCQALEAGGMHVVKTSGARALMDRANDDQYKMVDHDVYETTLKDRKHPQWPRMHDGSVVKVVIPWLGLLRVHDYRVVFMRRDPEEIRQSYIGAFRRGPSCARDVQVAVDEGRRNLLNRKDVFDLTDVWFHDFIENPVAELGRLGLPIDEEKAAAIVKPDLYRARRDRLPVGV